MSEENKNFVEENFNVIKKENIEFVDPETTTIKEEVEYIVETVNDCMEEDYVDNQEWYGMATDISVNLILERKDEIDPKTLGVIKDMALVMYEYSDAIEEAEEARGEVNRAFEELKKHLHTMKEPKKEGDDNVQE